MAVIVDIDHEGGTLGEYSTTVTDSGDLSVAAGAALAGTGFGLNVLIDGTGAIYGQVIISPSAFRFRFYVDPNTLAMANNDLFDIFQITQNGGSFLQAAYVRLKFVTGTGYQLQFNAQNDAGVAVMSDITNITDAPHYVEGNIVKAATDLSIDGTAQWWVDGVDQGIVVGIDNFNILTDQNFRVRLGAVAGIDAGTSGTLFLDQLVVNNDGSAIGAYIPVATLSIQDAAQAQSAENVTLTAHVPVFALTIANGAQAQNADTLSLVFHPGATVLNIQDATQIQTVDAPYLYAFQPAYPNSPGAPMEGVYNEWELTHIKNWWS